MTRIVHHILVGLTCGLFAGTCGQLENEAYTPEVPTVTPRVVRTIPHDTTAFTQGLLFHNGTLLESTGAPRGRESSLRVIDPRDGRVLQRRAVPGVFAEGIAVAGGSLVQLAWRCGTARVYALPTLSPVGELRYSGEGWGLTHDGESFIMSNGSDTLYFRDTAFKATGARAVTLKGRPLRNLNELEHVDGWVYANVWHSSYVFQIDPRVGKVERIIDCTELVLTAGGDDHRVLNGIAYESSAGTFYLTGKDWPVIFEVAF